MTVAFLFWKH